MVQGAHVLPEEQALRALHLILLQAFIIVDSHEFAHGTVALW